MILVTGPTGSGKSTTLYATLNIVSTPEVNVITVEDPVEYRLPGINQVQTNAKAGLTFAAALRSILRSDPDVVLLGEIRDHETAQIAVEAALTGHLVLTTLHTNDAPSAITRLTEMGIEPFLVGSALDCVLAQRLARRLCPSARRRTRRPRESLAESRFPLVARRGRCRCSTGRWAAAPCATTGYKGRLALHEVMAVSEEIERLAVERGPRSAIGRVARRAGDDHAARGRPAQGPGRPDVGRGGPARRRLTVTLRATSSAPPGPPMRGSRARAGCHRRAGRTDVDSA